MNKEKLQELNQEAQFLQSLGNLPGALKLYQKILKIDPKNISSSISLIQILIKLARSDEALQLINKFLKLNQNNKELLSLRANLLVNKGDYHQALMSYQDQIKVDPDDAKAYFNAAVVSAILNNPEQSIKGFKRAIEINKDFFDAYLGLGNVYYHKGSIPESLDFFNKAIELNPLSSSCFNNRSLAYSAIGNNESAKADLIKALELNDTYPEAYYNLGNILFLSGEIGRAIDCFSKAILFRPDYLDAKLNKATALSELNKIEDALEFISQVIDENEKEDRAYAERAVLFGKIHQYNRALEDINHALSLNAENPVYHGNRAIILKNLKMFEEAIKSYKQVISLDEKLAYSRGEILSLKMCLCDWSNYQEEMDSIEKMISGGIEAIQPLSFLSVSSDLNLQFSCAKVFAKKYLKPASLEINFRKQSENEILNIGYFSADFHSHATMHLFAEILEKHNREKFKVFCFSFGPPYEDSWRERAKNACDEFIDVRSLSDLEIAKLARENEIDIAIDLKGFTEDCRPSSFAHRAAPVQINYLGYPGTMASPYVDYIVADKILIDEESKKYYQEKIIYLLHSYQPNCSERDISANPTSRQKFGLPEDAIIFCCFNSNHKITPKIFDAWMTILSKVDHSILWLYAANDTAKNNLLTEVAKRNIDENRIIFAQKMDVEDHLSRLRHADIFLDTYPYNAHTTASDVLRMGIPIITLMGQSFASRVGASLLSSIGMDDLITSSLDDYISKAVDLASDKSKLSAVKKEINRATNEGPLFNSDDYTKNYEKSLIAAYQNYVKNDEARDIKVSDFN